MYDGFEIHLDGLSLGEHKYLFLLDNLFFKSLEYSLIDGGNVEVILKLNKKERLFELDFNFKGQLTLLCDRCGEYFEHPVNFENETVLKFGEEAFEDEGLIVLDSKETVFDISHYLYETLCLSLPAKKIHPDKKGKNACNPNILKQLEDYSKNQEKQIDSRWESLNKLIKN